MIKFKIVNNESEINLSRPWMDSRKFKSKDKIINLAGRQYKLIAKKERLFSRAERIGRGFLGTLAVCCSLGCALFSKNIRNLFSKEKEVLRFGIIYNPSQTTVTNKKIQSLIIGPLCMESMPCRHANCIVTYTDGQKETRGFNGVELKELIAKLPKENVTGNDGHFDHQRFATL